MNQLKLSKTTPKCHAASVAFMQEGVILSVPATMQPRDIIKALKELERMALESYLKRTADCGGT